ncbi:MAG: hypothetical protein A2511_15135 [Deltaproteobacteria bacterium RIFOXYD12_FULL_50_9]|nr:MAG: hypothetical protein A2511_15135 [Deltaproteobacteria bacterium RIFOXYD12_FULL_50_9]
MHFALNYSFLASILLFLCLLLFAPPTVLSAGHPTIKIEGRVFSQFGPLPEARVLVYKSYADLVAGAVFLNSRATDTNGVYKLELPAGEYLFTARGQREGKEYMGYHGNNPINIDKQNIWLPIMVNEIKQPVLTNGPSSLDGIVTYKGEPVSNAYVTIFREGTPILKGLGFITEANRPDATFKLPVPAGKYIIIAKKLTDLKRVRPLKEGDLYCYYPANPVEVPADRTVNIDIPCYPKGDRSTFSGGAKLRPDNMISLDQLPLPANANIIFNKNGDAALGKTMFKPFQQNPVTDAGNR